MKCNLLPSARAQIEREVREGKDIGEITGMAFTPAEEAELAAVLPIINGNGTSQERFAALNRLYAVIEGTFTPPAK